MTPARAFRSYLEAFNRGDVPGIAHLYAERTQVVNPLSPEPLRTRADVEAFVAPMFGSYSGMHADHDRIIVSGPWLATRLTIRARHTGELRGPAGVIAATGREIVLRSAEFMCVDDEGLIVHHERIFDTAAIVGQLGDQERGG